ncbi:hypothetical protein BGZ80_000158, partial [Entomortierella chlamydospora]
QLDTELARMKTESQRHVDQATSWRDTRMREINVYREQQTQLTRNAFDVRVQRYIQQEKERLDALDARARLLDQQAQERRDARERLKFKREQSHRAAKAAANKTYSIGTSIC